MDRAASSNACWNSIPPEVQGIILSYHLQFTFRDLKEYDRYKALFALRLISKSTRRALRHISASLEMPTSILHLGTLKDFEVTNLTLAIAFPEQFPSSGPPSFAHLRAMSLTGQTSQREDGVKLASQLVSFVSAHVLTLREFSLTCWETPSLAHTVVTMTNLEFLALCNTAPAPSLSLLTKLQHLELRTRGDNDSSVSFLSALTNLHTLLLPSLDTTFTPQLFVAISALTSLTSLQLDQPNYMTDAVLNSIASLTQLRYLQLANFHVPDSPAPLSNQGLLALQRLTRLEDLSYTHVAPTTEPSQLAAHDQWWNWALSFPRQAAGDSFAQPIPRYLPDPELRIGAFTNGCSHLRRVKHIQLRTDEVS